MATSAAPQHTITRMEGGWNGHENRMPCTPEVVRFGRRDFGDCSCLVGRTRSVVGHFDGYVHAPNKTPAAREGLQTPVLGQGPSS